MELRCLSPTPMPYWLKVTAEYEVPGLLQGTRLGRENQETLTVWVQTAGTLGTPPLGNLVSDRELQEQEV